MRMTSKGQVTIPLALRQALGLMPNTEVEFELDGDAVRVKKAAEPSSTSCAGVEHGASPPTRS